MTEAAETPTSPPKRSIIRTVLLCVGVIVVLGVGLIAFARHSATRDSKLAVGATAPDFTLPDQTGTAVSLSAVLTDHRGAIVAFYPKDFTPG